MPGSSARPGFDEHSAESQGAVRRGRYAINVTGNTDLKGGIITSAGSAEAQGNNRFVTGTLTASEIENHAEYKGRAFGISGGVSGSGASRVKARRLRGRRLEPLGA